MWDMGGCGGWGAPMTPLPPLTPLPPMSQGWLSLSHARYSLGCHRVSALQYGATMEPRVRVVPRWGHGGQRGQRGAMVAPYCSAETRWHPRE